MPDRKYYLPEIPPGYQIFEDGLEVAGIGYRRSEARKFATGRDLSLEFQRDPENQHDPDAIKVIGCRRGFFGTKKHFIGYVPREVAAAIVVGGYYEQVAPRLLKTYVGDSGFVEVLFQVLGPKGQRLKYKCAGPESLSEAMLGTEHHFSDFVDRVQYLKQEKRYEEAVALLINLIAANEEEAKRFRCGVAPWYYEQLAMLYRKGKRYNDELTILERFESQPKAPGVGPQKLARLLETARARRNGLPT